jgi:hypothetical protein
VKLRLLSTAALILAACTGAGEREGASRLGAPPARSGGADPLQAAASNATLVVERDEGRPWHAFLGADGSARRIGDDAQGKWLVDQDGRLCTDFPDDRNCWWVVRDGSSEPAFRGERPGDRAHLARSSPEL